MSNTELTTMESTGLSFGAFKAIEEDVVGLDLDQSDLKLPKIKLLQSTSQEVAKSKGKLQPGQFYNTVTQEGKDELNAVLLYLGKSMVNWKRPFKRGEEPLCRSFDGKTKTEGCGDGNCQTCQFSSQNPKAWEIAKQNGETKPPCNMSYVWLGMDRDTNMPFRLIVSGASVTPTKDFLNKIAPLRVSPCAGIVTLKSDFKENDQGSFYVLEYGDFTPNPACFNEKGQLDAEQYQKLKDLAITYRDIFMTSIVMDDVVNVDDMPPTEGQGAIF